MSRLWQLSVLIILFKAYRILLYSNNPGSIKETQDVINLCDKHKIYPDIKVVSVAEINNVYTALDSGSASTVRYVLDLENTLKEGVVCSGGPPQIGDVTEKLEVSGVLKELCGLFFCCRWL